jgi:hypothetical protein
MDNNLAVQVDKTGDAHTLLMAKGLGPVILLKPAHWCPIVVPIPMSGMKRQVRFDGGRSPPSLRAQDPLMTSQLHRTWTLKVDAGASYIFY